MNNPSDTQLKPAADEKPTTLGQTDTKSDDNSNDDFLKGSCPYGGPTESCESCS